MVMVCKIDKKICIVGTGEFAREILCCLIDILSAQSETTKNNVVFLDHEGICDQREMMRVPVIKSKDFNPKDYRVVVAISNPQFRKLVVSQLPKATEYISLIHPTAVLSEWVEIGAGSIITAGCILTCNIKLGAHTQLNLLTTVGHDCHLGDYFTTAPSANISGNCNIGEAVYFGTGASVKQGVTICAHVTIGMGGVVLSHITRSGTYVGVPVRKIS